MNPYLEVLGAVILTWTLATIAVVAIWNVAKALIIRHYERNT